jgi:hypothetical protein
MSERSVKKLLRTCLAPAAIVEEMLEMVAHSGPMRDPLLSKMESKHLTKALEVAEKRVDKDFALRQQELANDARMNQNILVFFVVLAVIFVGILWLFLHYGKTDQVFQLISMIFVGGGGIGIGTSLKNRRRHSGSSTAPLTQSDFSE